MARDSRPVRPSARRTFSQMAAELHHHGGIGVGKRRSSSASGKVAGNTDEHVVALRDRRAGQRPAAGHAR